MILTLGTIADLETTLLTSGSVAIVSLFIGSGFGLALKFILDSFKLSATQLAKERDLIYEESRKLRNDLTAEINTLRAEILRLQAENQEYAVSNSSLTARIIDLEHENRELKIKLEKFEKLLLQNKNISHE